MRSDEGSVQGVSDKMLAMSGEGCVTKDLGCGVLDVSCGVLGQIKCVMYYFKNTVKDHTHFGPL